MYSHHYCSVCSFGLGRHYANIHTIIRYIFDRFCFPFRYVIRCDNIYCVSIWYHQYVWENWTCLCASQRTYIAVSHVTPIAATSRRHSPRLYHLVSAGAGWLVVSPLIFPGVLLICYKIYYCIPSQTFAPPCASHIQTGVRLVCTSVRCVVSWHTQQTAKFCWTYAFIIIFVYFMASIIL